LNAGLAVSFPPVPCFGVCGNILAVFHLQEWREGRAERGGREKGRAEGGKRVRPPVFITD